MFPIFSYAQTSQEQWPCDSISVYKIKETFENTEHTIYANEYYGEYQNFSLNITLGGIKGYPYSVIQCGSAGCLGTTGNRAQCEKVAQKAVRQYRKTGKY